MLETGCFKKTEWLALKNGLWFFDKSYFSSLKTKGGKNAYFIYRIKGFWQNNTKQTS